MHKQALFVTGPPRAGTTLTDKLLWNMPQMDCFSQPLPLLLVALKAAFLRHLKYPEQLCAYPLNDQTYENAYAVNAFLAFLQTPLAAADVRAALLEMRRFTGQYFKPEDFLGVLADWQGGDLDAFAKHYFAHYAQKPAEGTHIIAWKETGAEEFVPYFLDRGHKVILIIRDPRDIAASLYHGKIDDYGGQKRPLLFMARQWRKSAAYHVKFAANPAVRVVRYEDLVQNPQTHLDQWQYWLDMPRSAKTALKASALQAQSGQSWAGNSAFTPLKGISTKAIGRYADLLPASEQGFIEALCYGEMCALGYTPKLAKADVEATLKHGPQNDYLGRQTLAHYAYSNDRRDEEMRRWQDLRNKNNTPDPARFVFAENQQKLCQTLEAK